MSASASPGQPLVGLGRSEICTATQPLLVARERADAAEHEAACHFVGTKESLALESVTVNG